MNNLYSLALSILLVISLAPSLVNAQTTHEIDVVNGAFNPAALNIEVGDIVRWTNSQGLHNVDGNAFDFPDNPVPFGNEVGPAGWIYEFQFNFEGTYNYWCSIHPDAMQASLVVSEVTGINDIESTEFINFYPNPTSNILHWNLAEEGNSLNSTATLFDLNGKVVTEFNLADKSQYDISSFDTGMYFYFIQNGRKMIQSGKLLIVSE